MRKPALKQVHIGNKTLLGLILISNLSTSIATLTSTWDKYVRQPTFQIVSNNYTISNIGADVYGTSVGLTQSAYRHLEFTANLFVMNHLQMWPIFKVYYGIWTTAGVTGTSATCSYSLHTGDIRYTTLLTVDVKQTIGKAVEISYYSLSNVTTDTYLDYLNSTGSFFYRFGMYSTKMLNAIKKSHLAYEDFLRGAGLNWLMVNPKKFSQINGSNGEATNTDDVPEDTVYQPCALKECPKPRHWHKMTSAGKKDSNAIRRIRKKLCKPCKSSELYECTDRPCPGFLETDHYHKVDDYIEPPDAPIIPAESPDPFEQIMEVYGISSNMTDYEQVTIPTLPTEDDDDSIISYDVTITSDNNNTPLTGGNASYYNIQMRPARGCVAHPMFNEVASTLTLRKAFGDVPFRYTVGRRPADRDQLLSTMVTQDSGECITYHPLGIGGMMDPVAVAPIDQLNQMNRQFLLNRIDPPRLIGINARAVNDYIDRLLEDRDLDAANDFVLHANATTLHELPRFMEYVNERNRPDRNRVYNLARLFNVADRAIRPVVDPLVPGPIAPAPIGGGGLPPGVPLGGGPIAGPIAPIGGRGLPPGAPAGGLLLPGMGNPVAGGVAIDVRPELGNRQFAEVVIGAMPLRSQYPVRTIYLDLDSGLRKDYTLLDIFKNLFFCKGSILRDVDSPEMPSLVICDRRSDHEYSKWIILTILLVWISLSTWLFVKFGTPLYATTTFGVMLGTYYRRLWFHLFLDFLSETGLRSNTLSPLEIDFRGGNYTDSVDHQIDLLLFNKLWEKCSFYSVGTYSGGGSKSEYHQFIVSKVLGLIPSMGNVIINGVDMGYTYLSTHPVPFNVNLNTNVLTTYTVMYTLNQLYSQWILTNSACAQKLQSRPCVSYRTAANQHITSRRKSIVTENSNFLRGPHWARLIVVFILLVIGGELLTHVALLKPIISIIGSSVLVVVGMLQMILRLFLITLGEML